MKVINVKTAPNLKVGYIVGVGDEVPAAIEQLGVKVEFLTPEDLAWGDLSRFTTIVTGVRAYERRADLRANNSRLLDYVNAGGTFIVQYNKFEFNEAQYGPYPAQVSGNRVTDEFAPVGVVAPGEPLVTFPNEITERDLERVGPGARPVFPRRSRSAVSRPRRARGSVPVQQGRETRCAGGDDVWQGTLGVRRARPVAAIARRHRRRLPAAGQSDQPAQGAGRRRRDFAVRLAMIP